MSLIFSKIGTLAYRNSVKSTTLVHRILGPLNLELLSHSRNSLTSGRLESCRLIHSTRAFRRKLSDEELANGGPTPFSSSKARDYKATDTFMANSGRPKHQPLIIMTSLAVFMVYFLYIREENDIDIMLYQPLDSHIAGLDKEHYAMITQQASVLGTSVDKINRK